MTDLSHAIIGTLVDDASDFFAPAATDVVDALLGQYELERFRIQELHTMLTTGGYLGALNRFIEGNGYSDEAEWVTAEFAEALVRSKAVATMATNDGRTATPARKQGQSMDVDYLLMKD